MFSLSPDEQPTLLLQNCTLLPDAGGQGLRASLDISIVGQMIQQIGPAGSIPVSDHTRVIDASGMLAVPGLLNGHTHSPENLLKATIPPLPLELWGLTLFSSFVEWTPRLTYLSTLLGAIEMLKGGTTATLDHLWTADGIAGEHLSAAMQAYRDAGIRASVAPMIEDRDLLIEFGQEHGIEFPSHPFSDRFELWSSMDEQLATLEAFMDQWHLQGDGRLRCLLGPNGVQWCSSSLLESCLKLADRYETGLHLHALETQLQTRIIKRMLGTGGIRYLHDMGVLRSGTSLAHCIWVEPGDLEIIAESGATVIHNPVSNMRLGSGIFPLEEARRAGVRVALGSDGSASNDTQNVYGALKLAGLLHNNAYVDYAQWPKAEHLWSVATIGGREALGYHRGEIGELAPGRLADLVLLDLNAMPFFPLRDPYLHLVYCEPAQAVHTVIVNGQVVVEQQRMVTVDEEEVKKEIRERCANIWPGFEANLESVPNTRELMQAFDRLRALDI
ncbi:cytosine/adenosine deaminase-related metal-dependent hydrolase [Thermosporothrix hazakensis]|jgi:cytosine/adenosine deaminase-related metal-dependent hydrolase|uniref:Cytosine/adenosine deaminase-related metal-dependent hydrolase n=1 Tax=Thermosporothrix hazakensis TaxID=644383 RepID=A0A326U867_THEHA|nr:amidohydrolase family protein [Thermosporothrix hazakensis]PZW31258.1 cytosine/adenosine deaminase-related metal-dependent hydrolase [Thermosporothrix hazakensis]GCE50828.1 N-ethylammeline chlorohydrolase [Thermosporothrix hazakensis]